MLYGYFYLFLYIGGVTHYKKSMMGYKKKFQKIFEIERAATVNAPSLFIYKPLKDSLISIILRVLGVFLYLFLFYFYIINDLNLTLSLISLNLNLNLNLLNIIFFIKIMVLILLFLFIVFHVYLGYKHSNLKDFYVIKTTINTPFMCSKKIEQGNEDAYLFYFKLYRNLYITAKSTSNIAKNIKEKIKILKIFMFPCIGVFFQVLCWIEIIFLKINEILFLSLLFLLIYCNLLKFDIIEMNELNLIL